MRKYLILLLIICISCEVHDDIVDGVYTHAEFTIPHTLISSGGEIDGFYFALYDSRDILVYNYSQKKGDANFGKFNTSIKSGYYRVYCVGYKNHSGFWDNPFIFNLMYGSFFQAIKITSQNTEVFEFNEYIDIKDNERYNLKLQRVSSKIVFDLGDHDYYIKHIQIISNIEYMPSNHEIGINYMSSHQVYDKQAYPIPEIYIFNGRVRIIADIVIQGGENVRIDKILDNTKQNYIYRLIYEGVLKKEYSFFC